MSAFSDNFDAHTLNDALRTHTDWGTVGLDANTKAKIVAGQFGAGGQSIQLDQPDAVDSTKRGVAYAFNSGTVSVRPSTGNVRVRVSVKWTVNATNHELAVFCRSEAPDAEEDTDLIGTKELKNTYQVGLFRESGNPFLGILRSSPTGNLTGRVYLATKYIAGTDLTSGGTLQLEIVDRFIRAWWKTGSFDYDFSSTPPDLVVYDVGVAKDRIGTWGWTWVGSNAFYLDDFDAADVTAVNPNVPTLSSPTFPSSSSVVPVQLSLSFSHPTPGKQHVATKWEIDTQGGSFNPPTVYDNVDTVNLLSKVFHLKEATTYTWRAIVQDEDGNWSAYPTAQEFTTPSWSTGTNLAPYPLPSASFPSGSLPKPDQGFEDSYLFNNVHSEADSGAERHFAKWDDPKRVFTIKYRYLTTAEKQVLQDFWIDRKGSYKSFRFTHPIYGTTHAVRFMDRAQSFEAWFNIVHTAGLRLIEVFEPVQSGIYA